MDKSNKSVKGFTHTFIKYSVFLSKYGQPHFLFNCKNSCFNRGKALKFYKNKNGSVISTS